MCIGTYLSVCSDGTEGANHTAVANFCLCINYSMLIYLNHTQSPDIQFAILFDIPGLGKVPSVSG
jgi:hypothetical protein